MKKILLSLGILLLVVALVVVTRTLMHTPQSPQPGADTVTVEVPLDADIVAQHLSEAIRFPTVSHQRASDFEPEVFEDFIQWVENTYPEVNQAMQRERPGLYSLLYRWQGRNAALKPILITGHYDVVPVIPGTEALWEQPPFAGNIIDGVIWGRGALDDKSAVIAQLEAATLLLKQGYQPERTVYFSFGHDEEIGGSEGAASVTRSLQQQGVQLAWSLDEGSFLFKGMLPGVEPLMAAVNVAEKGSVTLNIVAKAAGGHSSMPPKQTAVGILAEDITRLEQHPIPGGLTGLSGQMFDTASRYMPFSYRMLFANRWLFDSVIDEQLSSLPFGNAMLRTTTAPTMLSASVKVNVLPIKAVATVNFRIHPRDTVQGVFDYVKSVVENDHVEVQLPAGSGRPASRISDWQSEGYGVIERGIRDIYGDVVVTPGLMIAGSDSRHYGQIADNAFRFNPMMVTSGDLTGFHGTNEKISVDNLAQGTRTYARIIQLGSAI